AFEVTSEVQRHAVRFSVDASLYFLACVGLYFVIPEWILFGPAVNPRALFIRKNAAIAVGLSVLFVLFPPVVWHGLLPKFARLLPVDLLRTGLFCCLALLTCIRFSRLNLAFWVVLFSSGLMLKAHAWDKYVLPLLVVFWYLKSRGMLDRGPGYEAEKLSKHLLNPFKRLVWNRVPL